MVNTIKRLEANAQECHDVTETVAERRFGYTEEVLDKVAEVPRKTGMGVRKDAP